MDDGRPPSEIHVSMPPRAVGDLAIRMGGALGLIWSRVVESKPLAPCILLPHTAGSSVPRDMPA